MNATTIPCNERYEVSGAYGASPEESEVEERETSSCPLFFLEEAEEEFPY